MFEVGSSVVSVGCRRPQQFQLDAGWRRQCAGPRRSDFNAWLEARPEAIKALRCAANQRRTQADAVQKRSGSRRSGHRLTLQRLAIDQGKMPGMEIVPQAPKRRICIRPATPSRWSRIRTDADTVNKEAAFFRAAFCQVRAGAER